MKTEKEKMLSGENYFSNDKELFLERNLAKKLLHQLNVTEYLMNGKARQILKQLLPNANKKIYIEPPFHCDYGYNIHSGENVYFNVNCVVLDTMKVEIGDNVFFGPAVQIYTATHPLNAQERKQISGLENLEKRLLKAEKRRQEDLVQRIIVLQNELFPNQSLEERQRNFSEYYLEYGSDFIEMLKESLKPLQLEFTVLEIQ